MTTDLPSAIQPEALTEALRRSGALGEGRVTEVAVEKSWPTVLSRLMRLRLTYDGAADGAPGSLIFKTGLPERIGPQWAGGRHEVEFYTKIAVPTPAGLVPRCHDAGSNEETHEWHLLLEDLTDSHASVGNWPLPPTREQAERIIATWARFHAAWWDDPRLGVTIGIWADVGDQQFRAFAQEVERFSDRLGERLSAERRDLYRRLIEAGPRLNARYRSRRDMTIVHGDAHFWNVFLPQPGKGGEVRLFDWDSWRIDTATDDLAYMMALHWFRDQRQREERYLLDHYHQVLVAHGVTGYDRRALDDDYRLSVLWQAATPVWQASYDIPAGIWWPHLDRIFAAIDDLDCRALLAG